MRLGQVWCWGFDFGCFLAREKRAGGPKLEALLLTESQLQADLDGMEFVILQEIERDVREGDRANNSIRNIESLLHQASYTPDTLQ